MRKEFLIFGAPQIFEDEVSEVEAVVRSGWLGTGPRVHQFEREFAAYLGIPNAAAVNSCTAALHLALIAAGVRPGDEVITTPMTFCATINAIVHVGGVPVLADVDRATMNIDPVNISEKITPRTRVILPVHFAGRPCDMEPIMSLANEHGIKVIEDCAHAIESTVHGRHAGTLGDFGCFSFYVTKNVVSGEGGMIVARDPEHLARVRQLALHGLSQDAWKRYSSTGYCHYEVVECGFKYNMMDIQAAIGIHQLRRVDTNWSRRRSIWQTYLENFEDLDIGLPAPARPDERLAYHLFTILIDDSTVGVDRDTFLLEMKKRNIGVGVHYQSIPEHAMYRDRFGWQPEDYPNAHYIGKRTASIPLSAALSDDDVADVIDAVRDIALCSGN